MLYLRGLCCVLISCWLYSCHGLLVGRGTADMTGLVSEGVLYGYANPDQDARGLHSRQYSRAFVFVDEDSGKRVAIVVAEIALCTQALKTEVVERLEEEFDSLYGVDNVMISATHSHSTPGGHNTYFMYTVPTGGFIEETMDAYADGIVTSIRLAHNDLQPGLLRYNSGELQGAGINRSPYAYDQNPQQERDRYASNTDTEMHVLKLVSEAEDPLAMINFFPVHTTSMKRDNHLISTDNKGYAAQKFESLYNQGAFPGQASIIGGFAQTGEGDVTPNIDGELCDVTLDPCSYNTSTCPEDPSDPRLCNSYGPNRNEFLDTQFIGELQLNRAIELFDSAALDLEQTIDYRHTYVNMSSVQVNDDLVQNSTCRPAMGYSFGAGATDGPGIPPFTQGELEYNSAVDRLVRTIYNYSDELVECHYPKPILLPTGEIPEPIPWQPEIIPLQLIRLGTVYLVAGPAEFTTMSGRRITEMVESVLIENSADVTSVIMAGLSNGFTSYVTTKEEYQVQRYEGASVTYGPNTLDAYLLEFSTIATAMAQGLPVETGPNPPDLRGQNRPALRNITTDIPPEGALYGDVLIDVDDEYFQGDTATVVFVAGNPRLDTKIGGTFLEVQRVIGESLWLVEYVDSHWETRFYWDSSCHDLNTTVNIQCRNEQTSNATILWNIPENQQEGTYRISYYGDALTEEGDIFSFVATSSEFSVLVEAEERKVLSRNWWFFSS